MNGHFSDMSLTLVYGLRIYSGPAISSVLHHSADSKAQPARASALLARQVSTL